MQELTQWLKQCGFDIQDPILDGKVHRFDRDGKKNAWFFGVQVFSSKTGIPIIVAIVGDWKTNERFEFKTNTQTSREDATAIKGKMKEASAKAEKEREHAQHEVRDQAAALIAGARIEGTTEYLTRKKIPELYGAKIGKSAKLATFTAIPMRDVNGTLWGAQRIFEDGKKFYLACQKVHACFHMIPEDSTFKDQPVIYICEGFATAASVYQATKKLTIVAFDSGNLVPVAKAIRAEAPEVPIVICGDDDQWKPEKGNAGRDKAEEAAKAVLGKFVFPRFRDESSKPTDFQDLHALEGLDEVRKQIEYVQAERHYVRCLGHRDGVYYYTSSSNQEIVAIQAHSEADLYNLMPLPYWETNYAPGKKGINWAEIKSSLMRECRKKGIFHPENIRGIGVWDDKGRLVIHLGDKLLINGKDAGIHEIDSEFIYQLEKPRRLPHPDPLTLAECSVIHAVLNELSFERPEQKLFLAGWIGAARMSGILDWRPHLWVTGESGSGKSTVMQRFVHVMLGDLKFRFTGGTTEAGMRQVLRANAIPVVFDEFEADTRNSMDRVMACLEFIRQASTDSGDIVKGSMQGGAVQYKARFCAAVSAIRTLLNSQADRTRFTLVELKKVPSDPDAQWTRVKKALETITPQLSDRYFARLLHMMPTFRANAVRFEQEFARRHSQRLGQQYGPILAGWAALVSDDVLDDDAILELVSAIDLRQETAANGASDQISCLDDLMQRSVSVTVPGGRCDMALGRLVSMASRAPNPMAPTEEDTHRVYNEELLRYGLKIVDRQGHRFVFVSSANPQLKFLFRDTTWSAGGWSSSLGRITGAIKNHDARIQGRTTKGTMIPWNVALGHNT